MTPKEKRFVAELLKLGAEVISRRSCNDLTKELRNHFTAKEWKDLFRKYHQYNEHTDAPEESGPIYMDFAWMSYFAKILEQEAEDAG